MDYATKEQFDSYLEEIKHYVRIKTNLTDGNINYHIAH